MTSDILELIRAFPDHKFIWRNKVLPDGSPSNLKVSSWLPQIDLLADHRTKMFLSHCGNHGAHEAIFSGVPVLALPIVFDQFYIASRIQGSQKFRILNNIQLFQENNFTCLFPHEIDQFHKICQKKL